VDTDRFDVVGASPNALSLDPDGNPRILFSMLRALLEDRFALKVHVENRELPIYALTRVATSRQSDSRLHTSDIDCAAATNDLIKSGPAGRGPGRGQMPPCSIAPEPARLLAHAIPMSRLAGALGRYVGRRVVDETKLTGNFDFTLEWTPDLAPADLDQPAPQNSGSSIFTALQEQLGLKLESSRAMVPVMVIDHVEMPTPD
jgi:uncharacterized protein (TIGR03435 family)